MQFTYDENCGNDNLLINNEIFKYLIKARRHKIGDEIAFRNFNDNYLYIYKINQISKKDAFLELLKKEETKKEQEKKLHLIWCMVDPKTIEKYIASLNEMGLRKITFVHSDFSQKNFKINEDKIKKILYNSSSQCGRSSIIEISFNLTLKEVLKNEEDVYFLDFSENLLEDKKNDVKTLVIGCEGGFSSEERKNYIKDKALGFSSPLILRSETAIVAAASKILL